MTDYGNPDHDPTPEADRPPDIVATEAIEAALASAPRGSTVEAKANHVYVELTSNGWALIPEAAAAEGNVHVLGPDEQIVTVPDGHVVDVRPLATAGPDLGPLADPELATLADIVAQLEGLDPESRERVAAFVTHRYGPTSPGVSPWAALSGWDPSRLDRARAQGTYSTDLPTGADGG